MPRQTSDSGPGEAVQRFQAFPAVKVGLWSWSQSASTHAAGYAAEGSTSTVPFPLVRASGVAAPFAGHVFARGPNERVYEVGGTTGAIDPLTGTTGAYLIASDGATRRWVRQLWPPLTSMVLVAGNQDAVAATLIDGDVTSVVRFDAAGRRLWERSLAGFPSVALQAIAVDAVGDVYVGGSTTDSLGGGTNAGGRDAIVLKFSGVDGNDGTGANPCTANGGCADDALCTATGAATRTCGCFAGFVGDGFTCADVDECSTRNGGCDAAGTCTNTAGGRLCACPAGYTGDGFTCTDVNECARSNGGCAETAICTNTPGSHSCACPAGYTGDGVSCTDVDECATANGGCPTGATCTNTVGSRTCACPAGQVVSGGACVVTAWTRRLGSSGNDLAGGVAVDAAGSVFVTGSTPGTFDGFENLGGTDVFLVKYDADGLKIWSRVVGTGAHDSGAAIAVSGDGSIYVCGTTAGALGGQAALGGTDAFLARFEPSGTLAWVRLVGSASNDTGTGCAVDSQDRVVLGGQGGASLAAGGVAGAIFASRFDSSGSRQWLTQLASPAQAAGRVAVGSGDSVTVQARAKVGGYDGLASSSLVPFFANTRFAPDGARRWSASNGAAPGGSLSDASDLGDLVTDSSGTTWSAIAYLQQRMADRFGYAVVKHGVNGTTDGFKVIRTPYPGDDIARAVALEPGGNVAVFGQTSGVVDGHSTAGAGGVALMRFDAALTLTSTTQTRFAGTATDLASNGAGVLVGVGTVNGALAGTASSGGDDVFVIRY